MDDGRYLGILEEAWRTAGVSSPDVGARATAYARFVPALQARLDAMSLEDARGFVEHHRAQVRRLDRDAVASAVAGWMYDRDGDAVAVVALLGAGFHDDVVADPARTAALAPHAHLERLGGWRWIQAPVRARWRDAIHAAIPDAFAGVAYPGDDLVCSGDWPTQEECRYFCGKDWRTLSHAVLYRRASDLSFFAPAGLHYLLPAFLQASLEDLDGARTAGISIADTLLFKLSYGYMRKALARFTDVQRALLADVMRVHHLDWQRGPFALPDADLELALEQLDPSRPSPRRPQRRFGR